MEQFFTMWEWETIIFNELELTLLSLTREVIPADPIDDSIPEWVWLMLVLELKVDNKKKTTRMNILSEPYQSIMEQTWKNYTIKLNKIKDHSVKIKIKYTWE